MASKPTPAKATVFPKAPPQTAAQLKAIADSQTSPGEKLMAAGVRIPHPGHPDNTNKAPGDPAGPAGPQK